MSEWFYYELVMNEVWVYYWMEVCVLKVVGYYVVKYVRIGWKRFFEFWFFFYYI